jgi:hypothetical protein
MVTADTIRTAIGVIGESLDERHLRARGLPGMHLPRCARSALSRQDYW